MSEYAPGGKDFVDGRVSCLTTDSLRAIPNPGLGDKEMRPSFIMKGSIKRLSIKAVSYTHLLAHEK